MNLRAFLTALALALFPAHALAQTDQRVTQFRAVCGEGAGPAQQTLERARAQGWTEVRETAHPQLAQAYQLTQAMMQSQAPAYFTRAEGGRQSFLIVAAATAPAGAPPRIGCFTLDFDATAIADLAEIAMWLGQPATAEQNQGTGLHMVRWDNPSAFPGVLGVGGIFVAPGSPPAQQLGITGSLLAMISAAQAP